MRKENTTSALSGGIMLIGILVLLLVDAISFWPWILVVLALASLPAGLQRAGGWGALPALWIIVLAAIIEAGWFWPGILILVGVVVVIGAFNRRR